MQALVENTDCHRALGTEGVSPQISVAGPHSRSLRGSSARSEPQLRALVRKTQSASQRVLRSPGCWGETVLTPVAYPSFFTPLYPLPDFHSSLEPSASCFAFFPEFIVISGRVGL